MGKRIMTGLILLIVTLGLLFYLPYAAFITVTSLIFLYAAWEWTHFVPFKHYGQRIAYVFLVALLMGIAKQIPLYGILLLNFLGWLLAIICLIVYSVYSIWNMNRLIRAIIGFFVLIPCWLALNAIRFSQNGAKTLLFLLCIIWATDIGAYFIGKWFGKHKLIPKVSPNKTWEGLYGGLLFAIFIVVIGSIILRFEPSKWFLVGIIGLLTAFFSVIGDLFESLLKRQVGLKDSGSIFPGHGGLLDRIDSLLAAVPVFLLGCLWLNTYF